MIPLWKVVNIYMLINVISTGVSSGMLCVWNKIFTEIVKFFKRKNEILIEIDNSIETQFCYFVCKYATRRTLKKMSDIYVIGKF